MDESEISTLISRLTPTGCHGGAPLLTATTMMTPGIHLAHKPIGPSSFAFLQESLKANPPKPGLKSCHGGTLDPFASGLLLILIEPATRLFDYLHAVPKIYEAEIRWGTETDTGDHLGTITHTNDASAITADQLSLLLGDFAGWQDQVPPATSAKRVGGERAYVKAHRGEAVEMPAARVYLHEANWIEHDLPRSSLLRLVVRGGYYVRALVRDLGRKLGCGAHLSALRRTAIGPWEDPGPGQLVCLSSRDTLPWAQTRILTDQDIGDLRNERTIALGELQPPDWPLPVGFPDPQSLIRGFHRNRFRFLLERHENRLCKIAPLRGGL